MTDGLEPMTLRYDFDMCPGAEGAPMALFRDRLTVEALRGADTEVRDYFIASGFGLHVFDSGFAPDTFPAKDADARMAVIERLSANLGVFDLGGRDMNGFEFETFLSHLATTRPAAEDVTLQSDVIVHPRAPERTAAVLGVMFLTMVYLLVWGGAAPGGF